MKKMQGVQRLKKHLMIMSGVLAFAGANQAAAYDVYVGTQSGVNNVSGEVYKYEGDTSWTSISSGAYLGKAVMDLEIFENALYASTYDGMGNNGKVWRYDGNNNWTEVGELDAIVADMVVYRDQLYAVTTANYRPMGRIYRYNGAPGDWALVGQDSSSNDTGFFAAIVADLSGTDEIIIGDRVTDKWSTYSPETGLVFRQDSGGSCVWDIEQLDDTLYSGNYWGPIFRSGDGRRWDGVLYESGHHWDVEAFQGSLYVGGSGYTRADGSLYSGRLSILDGNALQTVWDYNRSSNIDGITRLAAAPDHEILYIGTGVRDGYFQGDGLAEVWTYDGTEVRKISGDDAFGGGVQSLMATNFEVIDVSVDIKPRSCPNPLNVNENGVVSVAILGTADFDVTRIDVSTVALNGIKPLRSSVEDVSAPAGDAGCTQDGADGYADLVLKFAAQSIAGRIKAVDGQEVTLRVDGLLAKEYGDFAVAGKDVVVVRDKGKAEAVPEIQWATTAFASSEYSADSWAAWQAVGEPNTFACGDIETAWAPWPNGADPEWIELGFGSPANAIGIQVYETYESGFIYQVDLVDINGGYHTVWTGTDTTGCPGVFELSFEETSYLVAGFRLYTQKQGWEEVDAAALVSAPPKGNGKK